MQQTTIPLIIATTIVVLAANASAQQPAEVTFASGRTLSVRVESLDEQECRLTSSSFADNAKVTTSAVRSIHFRRSATDIAENAFCLTFVTGETLVGQLVAIDENNCSLRHTDLGVVQVRRENVLHIERLDAGSQRFHAGDLSTMSGAAALRTTSFGTMQFSKQQTLAVPFPLNAKQALTVAFQLQPSTDFRCVLQDDQGKAHCSVQVSIDGVMAEGTNDLDFADVELNPGLHSLKFVIADGSLSIRDRVDREILKQAYSGGDAATLQIVNDADDLQIQNISASIPVTPSAASVTDSLLVDQAGQSLAFDSLSLQKGTATVVFSSGETKAIDLHQLRTISFGPKPTAKTREFAASLIWSDGTRLAVNQIAINKNEVTLKAQQLQQTASAKAVQAVFLNGSKRAAKTGQHALQLGMTRHTGGFHWGDANAPLRFHFSGFTEPVSLNTNRKIIVSNLATPSRLPAGTSDRLLFRNGTILPCRIETIDENRVKFKSPFCTSRVAQISHLRGCFFGVNPSDSIGALTSETVDRALRIPRFARDLEPEHMLMARNGDLLRGNLVSMTQEQVHFESRAEPLQIERDRIRGIVWLNGEHSGPSKPNSADVDQDGPQIVLNAGNDFVLVGSIENIDTNDQKLYVQVPALGECLLSSQQITSLQVNADPSPLSSLYEFTSWKPEMLIAPRWSTSQVTDGDAMELKGQPATDFELTTVDGQPFRLSDHQGKVVILDFWASWCQPCLRALPEYLEVMQQYSPDEVTFAAINVGETATTVQKFLKTKNWQGTFLLDTQSTVPKAFRVNAIPHLVMIDQQGKINTIHIGYMPSAAKTLRTEIDQLLQK